MSDPSKYDDLARAICEQFRAEAVIVIVKGGFFGNGAARAEAAASDFDEYAIRCRALASVLRGIALDIENRTTEPVQGWGAIISKE